MAYRVPPPRVHMEPKTPTTACNYALALIILCWCIFDIHWWRCGFRQFLWPDQSFCILHFILANCVAVNKNSFCQPHCEWEESKALWVVPDKQKLKINNWRTPSKRGICTHFVTIVQVAQNLLKFGMLQTCSWILWNIHAQCFRSQGLKSYIVWIQTEKMGGGGVDFVQFCPYFSAFLPTVGTSWVNTAEILLSTVWSTSYTISFWLGLSAQCFFENTLVR